MYVQIHLSSVKHWNWFGRYAKTNIKIEDLLSFMLLIYKRKQNLSLYFLFQLEYYSKLSPWKLISKNVHEWHIY